MPPKNIIFCADGTWNSPNQDENYDGKADPSNVYKLFMNLVGNLSPGSIRVADEQEKASDQQVAKYIHGVGDSRNPIDKLMGGAFGSGVIARIVRGYTFISRNYNAGDSIYLVGFSRGAYTVRALAGMIASQGLLKPDCVNQGQELAYLSGAEAWYRYRKATLAKPSLPHLAEVLSNMHAFVGQGHLNDDDFIPNVSIKAVGVWDTVGAMGVPEFAAGGERIDAFNFADTKLNQKVKYGFHALSRDEQRRDFTPTLWNERADVTQLIFSGAHADVGGGYPMLNHESELSDGALQWMTKQLSNIGVQFSTPPQYPPTPNPLGTAHKPWLHFPFNVPAFTLGKRVFPAGILEHASVAARLAASPVIAEPGEEPIPYV
jgi:hypothetical protein